MLKMGMVGGGPGSMIGDIHRLTAEATGKAKLVGGVFSADYAKSLEKANELGLDPRRVYATVEDMIAQEQQLPKGERMDFIAITTPNHLHVGAAKMALQSSFHVMSDKPLGINLEEAQDLAQLLKNTNLKFGMTYTYRGYAALQTMHAMIKEGAIGKVRKVLVDYTQGWLTNLIEKEGNKQASWRTDPKFSGAGGTIADIGTHAFNLAEYLIDTKAKSLSAQVSILVSGRQIDDDANMLVNFENDIVGVLSIGQACPGEDNTLTARVYGDKGGLIWSHDKPTTILMKTPTEKRVIEVQENDHDLSGVLGELPPGHPESFLRGFIDIYDRFIEAINANQEVTCPGIVDGVRGMLFIEKAITSSKEQKWVNL